MYSIENLFQLIEDKGLQGNLLKMHKKHLLLMQTRPAAVKQHHWWAGGYLEHVQEVMNYAAMIVQGMGSLEEEFKVSLDDVLLCAYVHDLDKLERYEHNTKNWPKGPFKAIDQEVCESTGLIAVKCAEFGITLTREHLHSISWHHGGWSVIIKDAPWARMSSLATILHSADILSGFIRGRAKGEPK